MNRISGATGGQSQKGPIICKVLAIDGNRIQLSDGNKTLVVNKEDLDKNIKNGKIKIDSICVQCIQKQRDKHNHITAYLLQDQKGNKKVMSPVDLKKAIANYQINVINLSLTSDNRLVDTKPTEAVSHIEKKPNKVEAPVIRANTEKKIVPKVVENLILDKETITKVWDCIKELVEVNYSTGFGYDDSDDEANDNTCNQVMFLGRQKSEKLNTLDSKVIKSITDTGLSYIIKDDKMMIFSLTKNIKMPVNCRALFDEGYYVSSLILNGLDWSDTEAAERTFQYCHADKLIIMDSTAPKLKNMYRMFSSSYRTKVVDLSTFKVPNLDRATMMFDGSDNITEIKLDGLNFSKTRFVGRMFYRFSDDFTDELVAQVKRLGWKGYPDGREDDFNLFDHDEYESYQEDSFSHPKQYYPDENREERARMKNEARLKRRKYRSKCNTCPTVVDIINDIYGK